MTAVHISRAANVCHLVAIRAGHGAGAPVGVDALASSMMQSQPHPCTSRSHVGARVRAICHVVHCTCTTCALGCVLHDF